MTRHFLRRIPTCVRCLAKFANYYWKQIHMLSYYGNIWYEYCKNITVLSFFTFMWKTQVGFCRKNRVKISTLVFMLVFIAFLHLAHQPQPNSLRTKASSPTFFRWPPFPRLPFLFAPRHFFSGLTLPTLSAPRARLNCIKLGILRYSAEGFYGEGLHDIVNLF